MAILHDMAAICAIAVLAASSLYRFGIPSITLEQQTQIHNDVTAEFAPK